jgi:hypothetical protein
MTIPPVRPRSRTVDLSPHPAPVERTGSEGYVLVRRTVYGQDYESNDTVRVPVFGAAHARVRVVGSVTQNLGDYNSARVEVAIEMPCLPEQSEVNRVYEMLSAQVDAFVRRELAVATGATQQA